MERDDSRYQKYLNILGEELVPAMGCTEPIAIAYAAAKARELLGTMPEAVKVEVSDNIIKNTKSVVVPNTGNLKGITAAAVAGIVAGKADRVLEVLVEVNDDERREMKEYLDNKKVEVLRLKSGLIFDLIITVYSVESEVSVRISHFHTNIVSVIKDGEVVYQVPHCDVVDAGDQTDRSILDVETIIDFAESVQLADVKEIIERQIDYNSRIAEAGITGDWGANIGSLLLDIWGDDIKIRAKAMASAASDARMSGCELPVVIVTGSGNQGITASIPVIEYAKELNSDHENLLRALIVSNLISIHLKTGIGTLSAYCGAVSAGAGAGAGIAWLHGGRRKAIAHTIVNTLASVSGIICDGAKPSCAAKIAASVEAGIIGFQMYQKGQQFYSGDGIVTKGVENTIANIGRLGRLGMKETDKEIIKMMLDS